MRLYRPHRHCGHPTTNGLPCRAWAQANGLCWKHGGLPFQTTRGRMRQAQRRSGGHALPNSLSFRLIARAAIGALNGLGVAESLYTDDDPIEEKAGEHQLPLIDRLITAQEGQSAKGKVQRPATSGNEDARPSTSND